MLLGRRRPLDKRRRYNRHRKSLHKILMMLLNQARIINRFKKHETHDDQRLCDTTKVLIQGVLSSRRGKSKVGSGHRHSAQQRVSASRMLRLRLTLNTDSYHSAALPFPQEPLKHRRLPTTCPHCLMPDLHHLSY